MDNKELIIKSDQEINHLLVELKKKLDDLKFKIVERQLKNIREVRVVKKDIARISTIIRQRKGNNK